MAEALAQAGARVAVAGRTAEALAGGGRSRDRGGLRGPRHHRRRDQRGGCGADGPRDHRPLRPHRHRRQRRRRWGRQGAPPGRGVPARRVGLDHGAQRPQHAHPDAGGGPRDDRGRSRWRDPEHHLGPRRARHQRGLLGLRRGEGRHRLADPPVGDRVGEARHPGQRDHADLRRHAAGRDAPRRPGVQGGHRRIGSRSGASARRATSSGRPSSWCPMRPRS